MKIISAVLILIGLSIIALIFGPVIKEEFNYTFNKAVGVKHSLDATETWTFQRPINIPDINFSIIIPKINASAPIVDNVNPANSSEYLKALKKGVAHASGTPYPGEIGNVYLFAHSTDAFYNVGRYNAVFFLIGHLTAGDKVDIYYKDRRFIYTVYDKKVVDPTDTKYLGTLSEGESTLTLQTCYPPGTTLKRLVVLAKLEEE